MLRVVVLKYNDKCEIFEATTLGEAEGWIVGRTGEIRQNGFPAVEFDLTIYTVEGKQKYELNGSG